MKNLINYKNEGRLFQFNCKADEKKAEILIYDFIGKGFWDDEGVSDKDIAQKLKEIDNDVDLIEVRINSVGGNVFMGWAIYNLLAQSSKTIHVYIDGLAASIASVIALAGDKVFMAETSYFMIHKPMTSVYSANADEMMRTIEILDMFESKINNVYKKSSNLDIATIKNMVSNETWIDAEDALAHGFVDEIVPISSEMKVAACAIGKGQLGHLSNFDNGWIKKSPEIKEDFSFMDEDIDNVLKEMDEILK